MKIVKDNSVTTSYGFYECTVCGSQFYGNGPALHDGLECQGTGYQNCIYHVGPKCKEYAQAEAQEGVQ